MNHYFLKILIRERQQQLLKDAGAIRLANSRNAGQRPVKDATDTPRQAPFSFPGAVVSGGSKV